MNQARFIVSLLLPVLFGLPAFSEVAQVPTLGVSENATTLQTIDDKLISAAAKEVPEAGIIASKLIQFRSTISTCDISRNKTLQTCDEKYSTLAESVVAKAQEYGNAVVAVANAKNACSSTVEGMKAINAALQLYGSACLAAKKVCDVSCGTAQSAAATIYSKASTVHGKLIDQQTKCQASNDLACAEKFLAAANEVQRALIAAGPEAFQDSDPKTVQAKKKECANQQSSIKSGSQQALAALQLVFKGNGCDQATSGLDSTEAYCRMNPTAEQCNCKLTTQASTQRCICIDDPRNPGCANNLAKPGSGDGEMLKAGGESTGMKTTDKSVGGAPAPSQEQLDQKKIEPGKGQPLAAEPGATGGGGAGVGGGSGNQMDKNNAGGGSGSRNYQSSLAGGWASASGGSFGGGGSGSDPNDPMKKYLPGGANDPKARGIASMGLAAQVTSQGGKSNWEKVKQRYVEKAPSLLGK